MVLTDNIARWQRFANPDKPKPFFITGTDEHGLKVQEAATKAGFSDPQLYVDEASKPFQDLAKVAELSHDQFNRTTDEPNKRAARELWKRLYDLGYIYKGTHNGWYSVSDETFYPPTQIEKGKDKRMYSKQTGKLVEWSSEINYFFALSKMQDRLIEWLKAEKSAINPSSWRTALLKELTHATLGDLSISRPKERNSWGVTVPDDDSQIMYVWFDALTNYLASANFPWQSQADFEASPWPANVQVVGKDIFRFHAVYWPAFLMAAGLPLPQQIMVHSHWTMGGEKMSKSVGNVVEPFELIEKYGIDAVRFFLLNDGIIEHDSVFSEERLVERYDTELRNKFGNLAARICGAQFSIQESLKTVQQNHANKQHISSLVPFEAMQSHNELQKKTDELSNLVAGHMASHRASRALREIASVVSLANQYLQLAEPWKPQEHTDAKAVIINAAAEAVRVSAILLQPFTPHIATRVLDRLAIDPSRRGFKYAKLNSDPDYGKGVNYKGVPPVLPLGTPIPPNLAVPPPTPGSQD